MDWIDGRILWLKQKLKSTTLKRALGYYLFATVLVVVFCFIITLLFCESWRNLIYQKYDIHTSDVVQYGGINTMKSFINLSAEDVQLLKVIYGIESLSAVLYSMLAIVLVSYFFFKNKLQEPINLLKEEAKYISREDLSFVCCYKSGDEMEEICEVFDEMRVQLAANQKNMWEAMEEQRRLNAAFAHDLRTPLTVLQGYIELLSKYCPQGKISEEKLIETISLMNLQVERLKNFSETMNHIHTLEAIEIKRQKKAVKSLELRIKESTDGLQQLHGIEIEMMDQLPQEECYYDEAIILEVVENLLSNALRYANTKISLVLEKEDNQLNIYVRDDGRGFSDEELYKASRPYYSDKKDSNEHFGIGLTICKLLCQKHGGNVSFSNSMRGGAVVCATFFVL